MPVYFAERARGRANNFDHLRLLLATLVIFSHSWPLLEGDDVHEPLRAISHGQMFFGAMAVDLFFVMSGFLITMSWGNSGGFYDYMRKRILRIYPGFVAAVIVCLAVVVPLAGGSILDASPLGVAINVATLSAPKVAHTFETVPLAGAINDSMWTIRHEFLCYLVVPALGFLGLLRRRAAVLALFIALVAGTALFTYVWPAPDLPLLRPELGILRLSAYFFAGATFFLYRERIPRSSVLLGVSVAALAVGVLLGGLAVIFPFAGTYIVLHAAFGRPLDPARAAASKPDFSYGAYLYAFPVQQLLVHFIGPSNLSPVGLFLLALPSTFALAALSWYLVERPFLRYKPRVRDRDPKRA